jgi:hypothetical protein
MGGMNFRDAYEFEPETYGGEGGGLPGMLRRFMQQQSQQQGVDFGTNVEARREYGPETSFSPQGGLLGRLPSLQAEQGGYQPISENSGLPPSAPQNPNFRQLARVPNGTPLPMPGSPAPQAEAATPQMQAQYEGDQAQQAREAAAARLARGIRSVLRAEAPPPDPVDIAKSAGIGLANGAVNAAGLPGDLLTGFGYFPNNFVANLSRRTSLLPQLPADEPDHFKSWTSNEIRHWLENSYGKFYQPQSRAGRFTETIGEMVPMVLAGEGVGVVADAFRGGRAAVGAVLREVPATLAKHAVAPGIAVQALEEARPDTQAGQALKAAYPMLRRVLPGALAAKRILSRRIVPQ